MVQNKGLQDHFIFTGHVPYREVPTYIGAMDICVAPHHEDTNQASPVKLFDYMAAGRPIIASDIEVAREIIDDTGCAVLTPPNHPEVLAENIIALINNETLRHELAENGRRCAREKYDRKILTKSIFSDS
jgi:glycosyltransferase involved in cell wall biosynthesis